MKERSLSNVKFAVLNSFSHKHNLKVHMKPVHEGSKPHECEICDVCIAEKAKLKKHIESVHEGNKP